MKKFFMFAAMASVVFVSCVKNEVAPVAQDVQQEITFDRPVLLPNLKSANEVQNAFPTNMAIGVWAHYFDKAVDRSVYTEFADGELYMGKEGGGLPIEYNSTYKAWKHATNNYYWPKNGSLTFSAYAPYNAKNAGLTSLTANGIQFANYVVSTVPSQQEDLLFSERVYDQIANPASTATYPYEGVVLDFKHALSSIVFKVKADAAYSTTALTIKKIELLNVVSKGSFNQSLVDGNGKLTKTPAADDNLWTLSAEAADKVTYSVDIYDGGILLDPVDVKYAYNGSTAQSAAGSGYKVTDLILLPQNLANCELQITFDLKNDQMSNPISQTLVAPLATSTVTDWIRGKRYIYTVTVALDEIYFEPTVTDWVEQVVTDLPTYDDHQ